jgi:hypothetical protein
VLEHAHCTLVELPALGACRVFLEGFKFASENVRDAVVLDVVLDLRLDTAERDRSVLSHS